ncbi:MAG: cytochrome c3 family protein [Magnetococcales bacterium]|nr:cytochrome c3 family protein [Magnetococcales bacterium]MBF0437899.1 cytochrome c3 family protein [Magnetococcales bacterium]
MRMRRFRFSMALVVVGGVAFGMAQAADYPTNFSNVGGIAYTRHNLTQSTTGISSAMMTVRNNYGEVCVYCHTPHGANENIAAPLWNRTFKDTTYQTYDQLGTSTLTATVNAPGLNSLTCLSCHDGTVAIDSIINMPGSGRYNANSRTSHQEAFLDSWVAVPGQTTVSGKHHALAENSPATTGGCLSCHSGPNGPEVATDFTVAAIGTDLRNDHPVGIDIPTPRFGVDFREPNVNLDRISFYDLDGDSKPDANEIRYYKTGSTYRVECASCHDPHGVSPAVGSPVLPTFLRKTNASSALCLTCHAL